MNSHLQRMWYFSGILACSFILSGCTGGAEDPFERIAVSGEVKVGGMPVEYGTLSFRGAADEKTQEVAQINLPVRGGKFAAPPGQGTTPGENNVTLVVYATDPDADAESGTETKVVGTYTGPVQVAAEPLTINLEAGDLQKPSRD